MKVLAVNKYYYKKGGSETYYFDLNDLLKKNHHQIIPFSMKDDKNFNCEYDDFFIHNIDYGSNSFSTKVKNAVKIIYSLEAKKNIEKLIKSVNPDIAHLHIFQHQLSPSIIHGIKKTGIPIVNTVHDLKVICPNYKMMSNNSICEKCKGGKYYNCFLSKCVKNSRAASLVSTCEAYFHSLLKSYSMVDMFICPSNFYRNKFIEFGIPENKTIHIPNFIDVYKYDPSYDNEDYFMYFGRLSEEKGLKTLLKAMKSVKRSKLVIVGTGPIELEMANLIRIYNLDNVEMVGFKNGNELLDIIKNSMFSIIPSEWYENGPLSVLEAMAMGKPVIGADIGGIPELIDNKNTGLVFETGNEESLSEKINFLLDNPKVAVEMGVNSRKKVEAEYNQSEHYNRILQLYSSVLK